MAGGTGEDTYIVDNAGDLLWEWANEGTDTVWASIDYTLPSGVEDLFLADPAIQARGNELNNYMMGNSANNLLYGLAGQDDLNGAGGNDSLYGGADGDRLDGGLGADVMVGGTGSDVYWVDNSGDVVWEWGGEGFDLVLSSIDYTLPPGVEALTLFGNAASGAGNELDNILQGNGINANVLSLDLHGLAGNDTLIGIDRGDVLNGGTGQYRLTGGAGGDRFVWSYINETGVTVPTMDVISDFHFAEGDRIDLGDVDANVYAPGNEAFTFIGQGAFTGTPGEINYYYSGGNTVIQLQTGTSADIEGGIVLEGLHTPDASWFVL
jgi:Ca2+-binding RTX toxin-like protein